MSPRHRSAASKPPASNHRLRLATTEDRPFIRDLSIEAFNEFGDYGELLPGYVAHPLVVTTICEDQGVPAGFIMLALGTTKHYPTDDSEEKERSLEPEIVTFEVELLAIAVRQASQHRGIGQRLIQHAVDFAKGTLDADTICLNVAETNHRARTFFCAQQFIVKNPFDGVYPRGQTSLRMVRYL